MGLNLCSHCLTIKTLPFSLPNCQSARYKKTQSLNYSALFKCLTSDTFPSVRWRVGACQFITLVLQYFKPLAPATSSLKSLIKTTIESNNRNSHPFVSHSGEPFVLSDLHPSIKPQRALYILCTFWVNMAFRNSFFPNFFLPVMKWNQFLSTSIIATLRFLSCFWKGYYMCSVPWINSPHRKLLDAFFLFLFFSRNILGNLFLCAHTYNWRALTHTWCR